MFMIIIHVFQKDCICILMFDHNSFQMDFISILM